MTLWTAARIVTIAMATWAAIVWVQWWLLKWT